MNHSHRIIDITRLSLAAFLMLLTIDCVAQNRPVERPANTYTTTPQQRQRQRQAQPTQRQHSTTTHPRNSNTITTPTQSSPIENNTTNIEEMCEYNGVKYLLTRQGDDSFTARICKQDSSKISGDIIIPKFIEHNGSKYEVTNMALEAFSYCNKITSIVFHNGTEKIFPYHGIGHYFAYCSSLTKLVLPRYVKTTSNGICYHCQKLTAVNIPDGMTEVNDFAFYGTDIKYLTFPNTLKYIGEGAFAYIGVKTLTIPNGVKLCKGAFTSCSELITLDVSGCSSIPKDCFAFCDRLQDVRVKEEALECIDSSAFRSCNSLKELTVVKSDGTTYKVNADRYKK